MKELILQIILLLAIIFVLSSCTQPTPEIPSTSETPVTLEPTNIEITDTQVPEPVYTDCVGFQGYLDNTNLGVEFEINGFRFTSLSGNDLIVNDATADVRGLQFQPVGVQSNLPRPATTVTLTAGAYFPEDLEINAFDSGGNVVDQISIPADNSVHSINLTDQGITSVSIIGGGGEGILFEICNLD